MGEKKKTPVKKDPIEKDQLQRLSPRLQVVCNSDDNVNAVRAHLSAAVKTEHGVSWKRTTALLETAVSRAPVATKRLRKPPPNRTSTNVKVACFVQLRSPETKPPEKLARSKKTSKQQGDLVTAQLTPKELIELTNQNDNGVAYIEMGEPLSAPHASITPRTDSKPRARTRLRPMPPTKKPSVLVGIIDVGGFDFAHPDFLDDKGKTRFLRIWDQGAKPSKLLGKRPADYDYGVEITQETMQDAIDWSSEHGGVAATDLIKQVGQHPGSHATHVASIAAGNLGVCPGAGLVAVSIAITPEESARELSLCDSTRLAHAVDYIFDVAKKMGDIPTVINISLGTNGHAHDGTSAICRWIDAALSIPGRCVCVAAGNSGQEAPQFAGDLGHLTGRIHASGVVPARGLETDLEWQVVGNGIADVSENELEIWHEPGDEFEISLRSPSGVWVGPVGPNAFVQNHRLETETFISIFNERYHPSNGANRISIFLSPRMRDKIVGIEAGTWLVRIRGLEVRDGRFDAWIERDDPRPLGRIGEVEAWRFPSYFTSRSNVDRSSVSSLACTMRAISVGNCDDVAERIHVSSSQGPTRDGRYKPEIAAPGTDIIAARGFSSTKNPWVSMTGTSMASPYVTGVAARMLAVEPRLSAGQIAGIMRKTAQPLPSSDYKWSNAAGYGRIDAKRCVAEAPLPFKPREIKNDKPKRINKAKRRSASKVTR